MCEFLSDVKLYLLLSRKFGKNTSKLRQSPTGTFQSQTTLPLSLMRIVILCLSDGPKFT